MMFFLAASSIIVQRMKAVGYAEEMKGNGPRRKSHKKGNRGEEKRVFMKTVLEFFKRCENTNENMSCPGSSAEKWHQICFLRGYSKPINRKTMATGKLLTGVLAAAGGAALGILLAPDKGTETRKRITEKRDEYLDKLDEQFEKFQDGVHDKLEKILQNLNDATQKTTRSQEGKNPMGSEQRNFNSQREDDLYSSKQDEERFSGGTEPAL
jgi:gas vesicle protein